MKLLNTLKGILTELTGPDVVQNSINKKQLIIINYQGKEYGKGYRTIEPVCLGTSKRGNLVLRAWEREGVSHSNKVEGNPIPGWRLFKLVDILTYAPTGDTFTEMRPNYNPNGDKSMVSVIVNAKFNNQNNIA
jgi:hypothetical protein